MQNFALRRLHNCRDYTPLLPNVNYSFYTEIIGEFL